MLKRMKSPLLLIILSLCSFICFSQVIYSDKFNEGINNATSSASLTTSINNNNLRITGDGTSGAWNNIIYSFHTADTNINVDISANPKFYIKVKAENSPIMRIDLIDSNGYVTNATPSSISLDISYQVFEIDFTGKLGHTKKDGPCSTGVCNVNLLEIKGIMIFLNPGTGMYSGNIDIEWLSLGENLNNTNSDFEIRYNQVGYFVDKSKIINIVSSSDFSTKNYTVVNSNEEIVLVGTTNVARLWSDANEYVAKANVSTINTPGIYTFKTGDSQILFKVGSDIYEAISEAALKHFYFNRASSAITEEYGGEHARNIGHQDTQVYVHSSAASAERPEGTVISAPKGWYDAGDYNKYIVNSGISTYTLLAAFEHYESYYKSKTIHIPETGDNIPDILDEVKWNLDWMLSMQDPVDGGVYHKLTGLKFAGVVTPEEYSLDRYVVKKSTAAALNFAAVMATASRIYLAYTTDLNGYSTILLNAAKASYAWAKSNPEVYFTNPEDVSTGEYGDNNVTDEFQWAAVELFITTSEVQYKNDINVNAIISRIASWKNADALALISTVFHENLLSSDINTNLAKDKLLSLANTVKSQVESSVMNISMTSNNYVWGSNNRAASQTLLLIRAYEITNDESYLNAAYTAMDYLLGRNGTGYCYVTGFGNRQIMNSHHRISEADNVILPIPGMLAGGPHTGQQDLKSCKVYPGNFNATSYFDDWCSYSTNEVAINWNAPLAYALNALQFYQDKGTLSISQDKQLENNLVLYPNPSERIVNYGIIQNLISIKVFDLKGRLLNVKIDFIHQNIDITGLQQGVYVVVFSTPYNVFTKQLIKK